MKKIRYITLLLLQFIHNMEEIDVISHLLKRMNNLQKELIETQNKLRLYEH